MKNCKTKLSHISSTALLLKLSMLCHILRKDIPIFHQVTFQFSRFFNFWNHKISFFLSENFFLKISNLWKANYTENKMIWYAARIAKTLKFENCCVSFIFLSSELLASKLNICTLLISIIPETDTVSLTTVSRSKLDKSIPQIQHQKGQA